jgi:hypothetical protein
MPDTHDFVGSYTSCLVLGYLVLFAILLLRRPLTALLSPRARWLCLHAIAPLRKRPGAWLLAGPAIVIGTWSHLLWDAAKHPGGWASVAALSAPVTILYRPEIRVAVRKFGLPLVGHLVLAVAFSGRRIPTARHRRCVPFSCCGERRRVDRGRRRSLTSSTRTTSTHINILLTHSLAWFAALPVAGIVVTLEHHEHHQSAGEVQSASPHRWRRLAPSNGRNAAWRGRQDKPGRPETPRSDRATARPSWCLTPLRARFLLSAPRAGMPRRRGNCDYGCGAAGSPLSLTTVVPTSCRCARSFFA